MKGVLRLLVTVSVSAAAILSHTTSSWADSLGYGAGITAGGEGSISSSGVGAGVSVQPGQTIPLPPDGPYTTTGNGALTYTTGPTATPPSTSSGFTWSVSYDAVICVNGQPVGTPPQNAVITAASVEYLTLTNPAGGVVSAQYLGGCPNPNPPPPPPPPPSPAQVWSVTPLPTDTIDVAPSTLGLTQLASWFWYTGQTGPVTATAVIDGYTVTVTAHPVEAMWSFGDGGSAVGTVGGSEQNPSASHTYLSVGVFPVTVSVEWAGSYTFSGYGAPAQTVPLGEVWGAPASRDYGVQEIRSVPVATPSDP